MGELVSPANNAFVAKEVRFSVVLYGGVSLAIYMNGVAQELLHMVRSTARTSWANDERTDFRYSVTSDSNRLKSTERVYRELANVLNNSGSNDVRFIIDVISGTSAGGINGIFLAKALMDDSLSFDVLQNLWIEEGALELLLNDNKTAKLTGLPAPTPPRSLLSSDRMYVKLLYALRKMKGSTQVGSPLSQEIDLFVTTTDISGRVVPLRLADRLVWERKYREDFHFACNDTCNDFDAQNDPFIAFVARCTSSFPFAFEPMQLGKIKALQKTEAWHGYPTISDKQLEIWENRFFPKTEQPTQGTNLTRAFGDGGYLNNKPFSYVIDMLGRHSSTFPTDRNLIYVEPSPEHPEDSVGLDENAPNALLNSYDALIKLPGYQPIHDDLQRVIERNRLVRKVNELSRAITGNITQIHGATAGGVDLNSGSISDFGYIVLRTYATTDDLSKVLAEWLGLANSSSFYYGIRCLVRAWREGAYDTYDGENCIGEVLFRQYRTFLATYDIEYESRKYKFLRQQINTVYSADRNARESLINDLKLELSDDDQSAFKQALIHLKAPFDEAYKTIRDANRKLRPSDNPKFALDEPRLAAAFRELTRANSEFRYDNDGKSIVEFVLGIGRQDSNRNFVPAIADQDENYIGRARQILPKLRPTVEQIASAIAQIVNKAALQSQQTVEHRIDTFRPTTRGAEAAKKIVIFFYEKFILFDATLFPLTYDTDVGTPELISVIRVSPDDATRLFDQGAHPGYQKLAGVSLGHFGAFLDRSFRTNDILWGRLDGAERIIRSLLPTDEHAEEANRLIDEAHGIIIEDFLEERQQELAGVIFEIAKSLGLPAHRRGALSIESKQSNPGVQLTEDELERLRQSVCETLASLPSQHVKEAFRGFLTKERIRDYLKSPPLRRQPERRTTLESTARAMEIIGNVFQGLGKETEAAGGFLARVAAALWWVLEAAVPNELTGHFARKVFTLFFLFEIVMVLGGTFFNQGAQSLGFTLLAITIVLWLIKDAFQQFMLRGKKGLKRTLVLTLAAALIGSAIWGVRQRYEPVFPLEHTKQSLRVGWDYVHRAFTPKSVKVK